MIMNILEEIHLAKNHSQSTRHVYQVAAEKYCTYFEMTLQELLQEAETEEDNHVKWKHRRLKQRLIEYRHYLIEHYPKTKDLEQELFAEKVQRLDERLAEYGGPDDEKVWQKEFGMSQREAKKKAGWSDWCYYPE